MPSNAKKTKTRRSVRDAKKTKNRQAKVRKKLQTMQEKEVLVS